VRSTDTEAQQGLRFSQQLAHRAVLSLGFDRLSPNGGGALRERLGVLCPCGEGVGYAKNRRALMNMRIHGLCSLLSPFVQLICTLRNTRSG
jgi:hypothetical protein